MSPNRASSFRWATIGLGLVLLLVGTPDVWGDEVAMDAVPEAWRSGVRRTLSGRGGPAFRATYAKLDEGERKGWAFLAAHMRPHVASRVTEPLLTEHVKYAYRARRELAWTKKLPEEVFLHYVLPVLSGDEPLQLWRKQFFDEVLPQLKKKRVKDLEKAALEVNKWCGAHASFKPTPAEDAGPLDTLKRKYGRCEELGILYVAVARSCGVPARMASTPYWTFKASNHAWCEVFTGKSKAKKGKHGERAWGFLGACEPAGKLNEAWFKGDVKRAAVVLSRAIGTPEADEVLSTRGGTSVINSTRYYTKPCRMTLSVADAEGEAAVGARLTLYIFNEVGGRPMLHSAFETAAGEDGTLTFDVGPGDYVVQASKGGQTGWAVATSKPGKAAACEITLGRPAPDAASSPGSTGVRILLGPGGKSTTVGLCRLGAFPWKPSVFEEVEASGTSIDLSPGTWLLQTGRRKGDAEVHVVLHPFVVEEGKQTEIRLPGPKPKKRRKKKGPAEGPVLTVLRYPRG